MALCAVYEDRDGEQIVPDREFAASEDRPGRDRELVRATTAPEHFPGFIGVAVEATATRTDGFALGVRTTDCPKGSRHWSCGKWPLS